MYGGGTNVENDNEERKTLVASYRKQKFEMKWDAFIAERNARELEMRTGAASSQSAFNAVLHGRATAMDGCGEDGLIWPTQAGAE